MSRYGSLAGFQGSSTGGHLNETASGGTGGGVGGGTIITQDEGIQVDAAATALNFVGGGVTATDGGGNVTTVTIAGGAGGGTIDAGVTDGVYYSTRVTVAGGDITALETDGSLNDPIFSKNNGTFAMGTLQPGNGSVCLGNDAECGTAVNSYDVAVGPNCVATELESQAVGSNNINRGLRSGVFGINNTIAFGADDVYALGVTNQVGEGVTGALVMGNRNRMIHEGGDSTCVGQTNEFFGDGDNVHCFGAQQVLVSRNDEATIGVGSNFAVGAEQYHCVPFVAKTPGRFIATLDITNTYSVNIGDRVSGVIYPLVAVRPNEENMITVTCPRSCTSSMWQLTLTFNIPPTTGATGRSHNVTMIDPALSPNGIATIWFHHTFIDDVNCFINFVIHNPVSGITT